jgi:cell division protein FtsB
MEIGGTLMIVLIVAIVFGSRIWRTHMTTQAYRGRSREDEALIESQAREIEKLSQRMAVLEKLMTDDDRRLAGEIERLRDDRPGSRY